MFKEKTLITFKKTNPINRRLVTEAFEKCIIGTIGNRR